LQLDVNGKAADSPRMTIRITSKRQVTFPAKVLATPGVGPGDTLELIPDGQGGYTLKPRRLHLEKLAPLRRRLAQGTGTFDLENFRNQSHYASLRD
jgi:bifunctional DNA-binding transcriptional regulator/antitoxin component of YhaV-PrlF toxin-antitoxin module